MDAAGSSEVLPGTERMEAFTDGVLAVVATLLVLSLDVPHHLADHATYAQVLESLRPVAFKLISFSLSFLFVAIVWVNHHQIFNSLKGADRGLLWVNNLLLFWMCLLPFPTAFLGEYPSVPLAPMLLSADLCAGALAILLLVKHADSANLYHDSVHNSTRTFILRRSLIGPPAFAGTAALAAVSPHASIVAIFCVMMYFFIPTRVVHNAIKNSSD